MQFSEQLLRLHRLRFGVFLPGAMTDYARLHMIGQKLNPHRIERGTDGRDLVQNIDAVAFFVDHALDAGDLTGDTLDSGLKFFCIGLFDPSPYTPTGYMSSQFGRLTPANVPA